MQEKKPRRGIQSVEIAFRILDVLQKSQQAMALKDVAPLAGLTASAANNYLVSLVRIGLAAADEKPGYYRVIAFVVTPAPLFEFSKSQLPKISSGASVLPPDLAAEPFKGKRCHVLIYSMKRWQGGRVEPFADLSVEAHVTRSGILNALR